MNKILATKTLNAAKGAEFNAIKSMPQQICPSNPRFLERSANRDYFDFSTEDKGFFTRKDEKGNVLEVIRTIFPR